jgi:hypothetical protein
VGGFTFREQCLVGYHRVATACTSNTLLSAPVYWLGVGSKQTRNGSETLHPV